MKCAYILLAGITLAGCATQKAVDREVEAMMQGLMAMQQAMQEHNQVKEQRDRDNRAAFQAQNESYWHMQRQHDYMNQQMLQQ